MRCLVRTGPDHHYRHRTPLLPWNGKGSVAARLIPKELAGARASFEPRHGEAPESRHVVRKPGHNQPAGGYRASQPGPLNATTWLTAIPARPHRLPEVSIRRLLALCPGKGPLQSVRSRRLPPTWCVCASIVYGLRRREGYRRPTARNDLGLRQVHTESITTGSAE